MADPARDPDFEQMQQLAFRALLAGILRRPPRVVFVVLGVLLAVGVARGTADRWLGPHGAEQLLLAGAHIPELVRQGEWWRLITATLLHGDPSHLLLNVVGLFVLGRPVEAAWGPARFTLICAGAALGGSLTALPQQGLMSVGASGALFGLLAALAILGVRAWPRLTVGLRMSLVALPIALLATMLLLGSAIQQGSGRVDLHAHLGGTFAGAALALLLRPQLPLGEILRGSPRRERGMSLAALGVAAVVLLACGLAAGQVGAPLRMETVRATPFVFQGQRFAVPAGLPRGIWREGRCEGGGVDPAWVLASQRTLCVALPLGSVLLIDRRDRQLTMDAGDFDALRTADRTGRFVWRQESVMVHPVGDRWLYLLLAAEPLLRTQADALQPLLPPPGSARVEPGPLAGSGAAPALSPSTAATPTDPTPLAVDASSADWGE